MNKVINTFLLLILCVSHVAAEEELWEYQLVEGDSLWKISHSFLKDWRLWTKLQKFNKVEFDKRMKPGSRIQIPVQWLNMQDAPAHIVSFSGQVSLFDEQGETIQFNADTPVKAGYALHTEPESSALLAFEDGSKMLVQQDTRVEFDTASTIGSGLVYSYKVGLPQGKIENRANPLRTPGSTFLVETPSSVTATRGTIYRVGTDGTITGTEVTQGHVSVGNDLGEVTVKQGFGLITEKGKAPSKPVQLLPAPVIEADFGRFRYLPGSVQWQPVEKAVNYRVQIALSEDFESLNYDLMIDSVALLLPLSIDDGSYFMRVRAVDAGGLEGADAQTQFIIAANPLPAAHLASAVQPQQYNDDINLRWTQVSGAAEYIVEVALANDARAVVHRSKPLTQSHYRFSLNDDYGKYQWRVTGINANGEVGPAGHYGQFELVQRPYRPERKAQYRGLVVHWPFVPDSARYQVQLARDDKFVDVLVEQHVQGAVTLLGDVAAGEYFLRYRVFNAAGQVINQSPTHKVVW